MGIYSPRCSISSAKSTKRLEKPHSLSYQASTFTRLPPMTSVDKPSIIDERASPDSRSTPAVHRCTPRSFQRAGYRRRAESGVNLLRRCRAFQRHRQIDDGNHRHRHRSSNRSGGRRDPGSPCRAPWPRRWSKARSTLPPPARRANLFRLIVQRLTISRREWCSSARIQCRRPDATPARRAPARW